MEKIWRTVFSGSRTVSLPVDVGLLALRLWVGVPMSLVFGAGKVPPPVGFVETVGNLGFPIPWFFAWCAVLSEIVGGALIALGLITRPAALFLGFTMFVAAFLQKSSVEFFAPERLNPTHFMIMCIVLLLTGAGRLSMDQFLRPRQVVRTL